MHITSCPNSNQQTSYFLSLPKDIKLQVFSYLFVPDLLAMERSCKAIRAIVETDSCWKNLFKRFFPNDSTTEIYRKEFQRNQMYINNVKYGRFTASLGSLEEFKEEEEPANPLKQIRESDKHEILADGHLIMDWDPVKKESKTCLLPEDCQNPARLFLVVGSDLIAVQSKNRKIVIWDGKQDQPILVSESMREPTIYIARVGKYYVTATACGGLISRDDNFQKIDVNGAFRIIAHCIKLNLFFTLNMGSFNMGSFLSEIAIFKLNEEGKLIVLNCMRGFFRDIRTRDGIVMIKNNDGTVANYDYFPRKEVLK